MDALETRSISEQAFPIPDKDNLEDMKELRLTVGDDLNGLDCSRVGNLLGSGHYLVALRKESVD